MKDAVFTPLNLHYLMLLYVCAGEVREEVGEQHYGTNLIWWISFSLLSHFLPSSPPHCERGRIIPYWTKALSFLKKYR